MRAAAVTRDGRPADRAVAHAAWPPALVSTDGRAVDRWRIVNEVELAARLRAALDDSGRTAWELSRRANVKLRLVEDLLQSSGTVPIRALVRVLEALELEVELAPCRVPAQRVSAIRTVVDDAIGRLRED